jgi:Protein of unknown function (DUF3054)
MAVSRSSNGSVVVMAAVDVVALVTFVVAGLNAHNEGNVPQYFLRNAVPLVVSWLGFAVLLKTYVRPGFATLWRTWLVSVPLALVVRSLWVGSPSGLRFLTFLAVGLAFTALFLLIGRGLSALITGRGYPSRGAGRRATRRLSGRSTGRGA